MQRVLSFQMARGFGESSEFVTKRMCFSFLFSVGFLSLLCGFLLGRFAAERTIAFRAEKKQLQLAGNGLDSIEHLRHLLIHELEQAPINTNFLTNFGSSNSYQDAKHRINAVMSNLSFIPRVIEHSSCITASIRGSRESDRYVVVAANNDGIDIVLQLLKVLSKIHREYEWKPRRTLIFCMFFGNKDSCLELFSSLQRQKIMGYIALYEHYSQETERITATGTESTLSIVSEAINGISLSKTDLNTLSLNGTFDTTIDVPHVTFSLVVRNDTYGKSNGVKKVVTILSQILGETIWTLSESLIVKWDPSNFNRTGFRVLESLNSSELIDTREKMRDVVNRLVANVEILNKRIDATENMKTMDFRIFNDIFMDLGRALMCPEREVQETLSWEGLEKLYHTSSAFVSSYLNEMIKCYESAFHVLYDW